MSKELGDWQHWDDKDYKEFIEEYYSIKLALAKVIGKSYGDEAVRAVFERIASPSCYLEKEYGAWKKKPGNSQVTATVQENTPQPDRWKVSAKNATILWCSERDATEEELAIATSKDSSIWYREAREGYQYGAIFKKVKA